MADISMDFISRMDAQLRGDLLKKVKKLFGGSCGKTPTSNIR